MSASAGRGPGQATGRSSTTPPTVTGAADNASGRATGGARAAETHRLAQAVSAPPRVDEGAGSQARSEPWWKAPSTSLLNLLPSRRARANDPLKRLHLGHAEPTDLVSRQDSSVTMTTVSESTGLKEEKWLWTVLRSWMPTASAQMRRAPAIVKLQAFFKFSFEQFETEESTLQDAEDETRRFIRDMQDRAQEVAAERGHGGGGGDGDGGDGHEDGDGGDGGDGSDGCGDGGGGDGSDGCGDGGGDGGGGKDVSQRPSSQLRLRQQERERRGAGGEEEAGGPGGSGAADGRQCSGEVVIGMETPELASPRRAELVGSALHEVAASSGSGGSGSPVAGDQLDSPHSGHPRHSHHANHDHRASGSRSGSGSGARAGAGAGEAEAGAERGSRGSAGRQPAAAGARVGGPSSDGGGGAATAGPSGAAGSAADTASRRRPEQRRFSLARVSEVLAASRRFSEAAGSGALSVMAHAVAPAAELAKAVGEELNPTDMLRDVADVATAFGAGPGLKVHYYLAPSVSNYLRIIFLDPVHPNSMFKVLWDFLYLGINTWILLVTPLLVVFVDNMRISTQLGRFEFAIDLLCMLDVLMYFRTAIMCDDFRVKASRTAIARVYMRTWGVLDMLACIPFLTIINMYEHGNPFSRPVLLFRLTRLTKLLRMPHIIASNNVNAYLEAKVFKRKGLVPLLVLLTALFVTMHHMSCYYYYVGVVVTENFTHTDVPSWVLEEGLQDMEAPARYMVSLYFTMYTFLTVGYGDVAVVNIADKIWAIATAILGIVMVGWFMGAVAAYMGGTGGMEAELAQRRQDVFQFIRKRRIRSHTARQLRRYHDSCMGRTLGDSDLEVIRGLPRVLRTEVTLTLYAETVKKVPFMQTRPPQFVVDLLLRLKMRLYDKGEYVVHEGEIGREIYFLSVGELRVQREVLPEPPGAHDVAGAHRHTPGRKHGAGRKHLTVMSRILARALPTSIARMASRAAPGPPSGPLLPTASSLLDAVADRVASFAGSAAPEVTTATAAAAAAAAATPAGAATPEHSVTPHILTPAATQEHLPAAPTSGPLPAPAPAPGPHTTTTPTYALEHAASAPAAPAAAAAAAAGGGGDGDGDGEGSGSGRGKAGRRAGKAPRQDVLLNVLSAVPPPAYLPGMARAPPGHARGGGRHVMHPVVVPLGTIKPGGHFGFASCLLGLPRLNSVLAAIPSEVLVLVREDVDALIAEWPDIFDDDDLQPAVARQRSFCLRERPLVHADSMASLGVDRFGGPRGVVSMKPPRVTGENGAVLHSWQPPPAPPLTLAPPPVPREASLPTPVTPWAGAGAGAGKQAVPAQAPPPQQLPMLPQAGGAAQGGAGGGGGGGGGGRGGGGGGGGGEGGGEREVRRVVTLQARSDAGAGGGAAEGQQPPRVSASARMCTAFPGSPAPAALHAATTTAAAAAVMVAPAHNGDSGSAAGGGRAGEVELSQQQH